MKEDAKIHVSVRRSNASCSDIYFRRSVGFHDDCYSMVGRISNFSEDAFGLRTGATSRPSNYEEDTQGNSDAFFSLFLDFAKQSTTVTPAPAASATPRASPIRYSTLGRSHDAHVVIVIRGKPSIHIFRINISDVVPIGALACFTCFVRPDFTRLKFYSADETQLYVHLDRGCLCFTMLKACAAAAHREACAAYAALAPVVTNVVFADGEEPGFHHSIIADSGTI